MITNKNKWHYRIVHFPDVQVDGYVSANKECKDFCSYSRWFLLKLGIIILTCLGIGWYLGNLVGELLGVIVHGLKAPVPFLGVTFVFLSLVSIVLLLCVIVHYCETYYKKRKQRQWELEDSIDYVPPTPGFLAVWYLKFKDKYCPLMEYKGDN